MPLLADVRTLFRRRSRRDGVDRNGAGTERLDGAAGDRRSTELHRIEPKAAAARTPEEIVLMVRRIGDHLEGQTQRTERLLELMDRLPPAIDALPEINRQNARFVETLHEHFGQAKRREEALNATLSTITEASGRQTEVLGLVQQHLDTSSQTSAQLSGTLETLRETLGDFADANGRTVSVLSSFMENAAKRETELIGTITGTQRWMIGAAVFCGLASVTAIVVALVAFLS
jgi:hypothetical protein